MSRVERGRRAYATGHMAEAKAAWLLRCKGYRILCRRFKTPVGEIDIIARRGNTLVFVEVKNRATLEIATAAISSRSVSRIRRAIEYYLAYSNGNQNRSIRLDVMVITPLKLLPIHIQNAFADQQPAGYWA